MVIFASLLSAGAGLSVSEISHYLERVDKAPKTQSSQGLVVDLTRQADETPVDQRILQEKAAPRLKYVQVRYGGREIVTLDEASRITLAKQAADSKRLRDLGLSWKDLYGVIHAETAWVPRDGMGKNGVVSSGLAQLEPNTAEGLIVTDPNDPVQAVHASAALMRDAAVWAKGRLRGMDLSAKDRAVKVREGVSIYYNLSTKGRSAGDGTNASAMPIETQHHIRNTRDGAILAASLEKRLVRQGLLTEHQAHGSYTKASFGGKLEGGTGSVAGHLQSMLSSQTAFLSMARLLQEQLDRKCNLLAPGSAIEMTHACIATNPLVSRSATAPELHAIFPKMTLAGEVSGMPVFIARSDAKDAAALGEIKDGNRLVGGIVLTEGLVRAAQGPELSARLAFVIGHEIAHLDHRHVRTDSATEVARHENEADAGAIEFMKKRGFADSEILSSAKFVMDLIQAEFPEPNRALAVERWGNIESAMTHNSRSQRQHSDH